MRMRAKNNYFDELHLKKISNSKISCKIIKTFFRGKKINLENIISVENEKIISVENVNVNENSVFKHKNLECLECLNGIQRSGVQIPLRPTFYSYF